jgi:hypothetical protein
MGNCNCKHGSNGTSRACSECDILQLARNNYFTGKLLVERDFTDEQRYTMGKLRRHNQRLHGWGVACGLKVREHPNPACQSQYLIVESGTAIDCCGREILVPCEEYFDFEAKFLANWQKQNGPGSTPDTNKHTLQICVSYNECAAENVPALFDDCADPGACRPNRILESHSWDVITDPPPCPQDPRGVKLQWDFTKNIANAVRVAEYDGGNMYVLTTVKTAGVWSAALYVIDTANYALMTSVNFADNQGLDVAVSPSGDFVYVALQPATGAPQIYVYSNSNFTATSNQLTVGPGIDNTLRLTILPGTEGSLFAYGQTAGVWAISGADASGGPPPVQVASITAPPVAIVISDNNQYAYVASSGSSNISAIPLVSPWTVVTPPIALPTAPTSLAVSATTSGETLAALDTSGKTLYFVDIPSAGPASATVVKQTVTGFAYAPLQVLLSPGGRWAYVIEQDSTTNNAYVQSVDEHAVELAAANVLGAAVVVGIGPQSETLSQDGSHLYVPYINTTTPNLSGVAIIDVTQADCGDIFETLIDHCPDCDEGNCLVLATITGYVYGSAVTDSGIDNLTDRRLLASTSALTKVVRCLIDQSAAGAARGPQGPQGKDGTDGSTGQAGLGLETGLVQISALSWTHGDTPPQNGLMSLAEIAMEDGNPVQVVSPFSGLVIAFSGEIQVPADPARVFEVLVDSVLQQPNGPPLLDRRAVVGSVFPVTVKFDSANQHLITAATLAGNVTTTQALVFALPNETALQLRQLNPRIWVRLRGDFVMDTGSTGPPAIPPRAISAEFVRAELNTGEWPAGSGLGLEGGTFESWLTLSQ